MNLPFRPFFLSWSALQLSRLGKLALALLILSPFSALDLAAQSAPAVPASAKELFTLPGSQPAFSRPSLFLTPPGPRNAAPSPADFSPLSTAIAQNSQPSWRTERFHWKPGLLQGLFFLGIQQGIRMQQGKTRRDLDGKFFNDWVDSVKGLQTWDDGGKIFTNYVAHPAQGAVTGYLWIHNDPKSKYLRFSRDRGYWIGRMKAMAWTAAWSTQFELGPIGEASLGNVGQKPGTQGYVDLVITPVMGTALIIGEDFADRYIVGWVERKTQKHVWRAAARGFFNPTRSVANLLRFRAPWYRDARTIGNVSTIPN